MGVLDEQGMGDRRFARRMEAILCHKRPVIIGPWTGEVGFELIYWIPFVRWVLRKYQIPADRLWVVSRGGTRSWYGDACRALCRRVRILLARRIPRGDRGGEEAAASGRVRRGSGRAGHVGARTRASRAAASGPDVPAVHAVLERPGDDGAGREVWRLRAPHRSRRPGARDPSERLRGGAVLLQRVLPGHARQPRIRVGDDRRHQPPVSGGAAQHAVRGGRPPRR